MKAWIKQPENHSISFFLFFWQVLFSLSLVEQMSLLHFEIYAQISALTLLVIIVNLCILRLIQNQKFTWLFGVVNLFSLMVFIHEEKTGTHYRNALLGACLLVLFISSLIHKDWKQKGIWHAQQLVMATYFLSALSKIMASGIDWFNDAPNIILQLLKSYDQQYIDMGQKYWLQLGAERVTFFRANPFFVKGLLLGSFLLELFSPILIWKRNWILPYGLLLLVMHIGIFYYMEIIIPPIILPMIAFFINPTFEIFRFINLILVKK
jgi:hypothetical protein